METGVIVTTIFAEMTYVMWHIEHHWNVSVLQKVHLSNLAHSSIFPGAHTNMNFIETHFALSLIEI
jgi:hypothetical protein